MSNDQETQTTTANTIQEDQPVLLKKANEIERVLHTALEHFPLGVIAQIALYAEFVKDKCWRCEKILWEHYVPENEAFVIWRSSYCPPELKACEECDEQYPFAWGCRPPPPECFTIP